MLRRWSWASLCLRICLSVGISSTALAAEDQPSGDTGSASTAASRRNAATKRHKKTKHRHKERKSRGIGATIGVVRNQKLPVIFEVRSFVDGGWQHGRGVRRFDSPFVRTGLALGRRIVLGSFRGRLATELGTRTALGAISEGRFGAAANVEWTGIRAFRPGVDVDVLGVWRPNWPDLYQPELDGGLRSTDRFSYVQRGVGGGVDAFNTKEFRLSARYRYRIWDYQNDPAFRAIEEPNHLVPSDHEEHHLEASALWRSSLGALRVSAAVFERDYFFVFARDRYTGKTHAGPGGKPANPLYSTRGLEPALSLERSLGPVALRGGYAVQWHEDLFQGYYSFVAHRPFLSARVTVAGLNVSLAANLERRAYGPESYATGPGHPPLTEGNRRHDQRFQIELRGAYPVAAATALTARLAGAVRQTNFPDYVPHVFPRTASYDIRWDYVNWELGFGVQWSIDVTK